MIITQKYHSSQEIDPEFIDSLEELMREHVPSFEWIKMKEKLSPDNVHYSYYLFFGDTRNSPIGYAQVAIRNEEKIKAIKGGFFKKKKKEKIKEILWSAPSSSQEGIVFEPAFLKGGLAKTAEIFEEYNKREEVKQQGLMVGDEVYGNAKLSSEKKRENIVNCLVKNRASYHEYIQALAAEEQKEIKSLWKEVYKDQSYRIGEYENFKECFEYKKSGSRQYKELRKNQKLSLYIQQADLFLTFESPEEVFAMVFLFYGSPGQIFFKTCTLDSSVSEKLLIQAAIMRFYEEPESSKLRFIERTDFSEGLQKWGFTQKSIHLVELKKQ